MWIRKLKLWNHTASIAASGVCIMVWIIVLALPVEADTVDMQELVARATEGDEVNISEWEWRDYRYDLSVTKSVTIQGSGRNYASAGDIGPRTALHVTSDDSTTAIFRRLAFWLRGGFTIEGEGEVTFREVSFRDTVLSILGSVTVRLVDCNLGESRIVIWDEGSVIIQDTKIDSQFSQPAIEMRGAYLELVSSDVYARGKPVFAVCGEGVIRESSLVGQGGSYISGDTYIVTDSTIRALSESHHLAISGQSSNEGIVVERCEFPMIRGSGVEIDGQVDVRISDCMFEGIHGGATGDGIRGIEVHDEASVEIFDCVIKDTCVGIAVSGASEVDVKGCTIDQNKVAVEVTDSAVLRLRESSLSDNLETGLEAGSYSYTDVEGCTASGNRTAGIMLADNACARIVGNQVNDNEGWGITSKDDAAAIGWGNHVSGNQRDLWSVDESLMHREVSPTLDRVDVPGTSSTIQEAVHRVVSGGTIVIHPGDYSDETVAVYKSVLLIGSDDVPRIGPVKILLGADYVQLQSEIGRAHV